MSLAANNNSTGAPHPRATGAAWRLAFVAIYLFIGLFGLAMLAGGIWLVAVGGSWYYALAGAALVFGAVLLARRRRGAQLVIGATWAASLAWALWEVGFNGWGLVPRVVGITVLFMLSLIASPLLQARTPRSADAPSLDLQQKAGALLAIAVLVVLGVLVARNGVRSIETLAPPATGITGGTTSDWSHYGGDGNAQRYSALTQITPENVGRLERAFVFHTGDLPAKGERYSPANTPLKIGNDLLMCSAKNILIAVNAKTGEERWRYDPEVPSNAIAHAAVCRGVAVYTAPQLADDAACKKRVISNTLDARIVAVDLRDGKPCADFGAAAGKPGEVDLWKDLGKKVPGWYSPTAAPTVVRDVIVVGSQVRDGQDEDAPSGVIRGYNAVTGELAWAWDLANPDNVKGPKPGQTYTRGTPNMWTMAVGDDKLGLVYLPISNSSIDYYGSNRSEAENKYSDSLVAVDVTTGREAWHFQVLRRDLWDYDLGSQPSLIDYPGPDGKPVAAVLLPTKQGDMYIFDRATGKPLIPIGEIKAPKLGSVEPDFVADTQPVSGWHSLRPPAKTEADMWGFSPVDQLMCRIQFRQSNYAGYLTPPSADRPWIQYPGYNGGSDWGSVAIDPVRRLVIANYNDVPNRSQLIQRAEADRLGVKPIYASADANAKAAGKGEGGSSMYPQVNAPYAIQVNAGWRNIGTGVPCTAPPYGGIRAISLDTGKTVWDGPLGTARRNGPWGIPSYIPFDIGLPNNGGSVVTAGGLVFIGAATDNLFRAIDIRTGKTVWQDVRPAGGQASPISYEVDGEQYVLIAATGHAFMETGNSDAIIVYKLRK